MVSVLIGGLIAVAAMNMLIALLFVLHLKGESERLAAMAQTAFAFIKADSIEEKVRTDALERQFHKIESTYEPALSNVPHSAVPSAAYSAVDKLMAGQIIKDETSGHQWKIA